MSQGAPLPAPLYQGSVNAWECDDGGHLNIRFHLERAMAGLAHMAHALEMPSAFTANAAATLAPREAHIRFLKEARPPAPLIMHGGVVKLEEEEGVFCLDMRHGDGAPCSAFTVRAAHVDTRGFRPFPWSQRTRAAAAALTCTPPAHALPRSMDLRRPIADASLANAKAIGAARIGATLCQPSDCDVFGRMRAEHFVGRVSDSVPNFLQQWRRETASGNAGAVAAGAVVEARLVMRRWPRAGDLLEIYSGVGEVVGKTMRLAHWICDPASGAAWASLEVVALTFDTITRKALEPPPQARAAMTARAIPISA
jgi:acyl-CoA thioester hydrolase